MTTHGLHGTNSSVWWVIVVKSILHFLSKMHGRIFKYYGRIALSISLYEIMETTYEAVLYPDWYIH